VQQCSGWASQSNASSPAISAAVKALVEVLVMIEIELNVSSEYGLMYFYDGKLHPNFPENAGTAGVTHTDSCVAFTVLGYVDGDAKVILTNRVPSGDDGFVVFEGRITCPSKALSLFDTSGFCFASVPLEADFADLTIVASELSNPDWVRCTVSNIASF
jgi:hypothetical protein